MDDLLRAVREILLVVALRVLGRVKGLPPHLPGQILQYVRQRLVRDVVVGGPLVIGLLVQAEAFDGQVEHVVDVEDLRLHELHDELVGIHLLNLELLQEGFVKELHPKYLLGHAPIADEHGRRCGLKHDIFSLHLAPLGPVVLLDVISLVVLLQTDLRRNAAVQYQREEEQLEIEL